MIDPAICVLIKHLTVPVKDPCLVHAAQSNLILKAHFARCQARKFHPKKYFVGRIITLLTSGLVQDVLVILF